MNKFDHVREAPDSDTVHLCHWPGCTRHVKPAFFSCQRHWFTWPKAIRDDIWRTYIPGQEQTKTPTEAYLAAARAAIDWAKAYERTKAETPPQQGMLL